MKTKIRVEKETLLLLGSAFNNANVQRLLTDYVKISGIEVSIIVEIRDMVLKKILGQAEKVNLTLYKHSLRGLYDFLQIVITSGSLSIDQFVKLEKLKNEIHKKII